MGRPIKKDSTDQSTVIRIIDSSAGTPENAVEHDTSGIDLWYRREGATKTSITEAALASLDAAHSDGGIELIGDGYYRLDLPDAAWATGSNGVLVGGTVTGMIVIGNYHTLVDYDPYDSVRIGITALPNAAADAAGGLPISDAGGLDLDAILADTNELQTDWANGGRLDLIIDAILVDTGTTLDGIVDNILTDTNEIQGMLPSKTYLTGTENADGDIEADEMTGELETTISSAAISQIASEVSTDAFGKLIASNLLVFEKSD